MQILFGHKVQKLRFPVLRSYILRVYRTIKFPAVNRKKPKDDAENLYFLLVFTRERQRLFMASVTLDPLTIFTLRSEEAVPNSTTIFSRTGA